MYRKLFSLAVKHEYFNLALSGTLQLYPEKETEQLLHRESIVVDNSTGVLELFYDDQHPLFTAGEKEYSLRFFLSSTDSNFCNYTAEDFFSTSEIALYHNTSDLEILNRAEKSLKRVVGEPIQKKITIIEVTIKKADMAQAPFYSLRIPARQTYWYYYLVPKKAAPTYRIEDVDQKINYISQEKTSFSNNRDIQIYRSSLPIAMRYRSSVQNSLIVTSGGRSRVLFKQLAVPSADNLFQDETSNKKCSHIYINL